MSNIHNIRAPNIRQNLKYNIGYNWIHNLKIDRQSLIVYIFYKNVFLVINFKFGNLCCARSTVAQTAEPATWDQKVSGSIPVWTHWNALLITTSIESCNVIIKDSTHVWIRARPKANSRAAPSVEAHHHVHGPDTGGRRIIIKKGGLLFTVQKTFCLKCNVRLKGECLTVKTKWPHVLKALLKLVPFPG